MTSSAGNRGRSPRRSVSWWILAGIACQVIQLVVSIRDREKLKVTADPWNARTLEWITVARRRPGISPCFRRSLISTRIGKRSNVRLISKRREFRSANTRADRRPPGNSVAGFSTAFFAVITGFAMIWHIWWMAGIGVLGIFLTMLVFAFREEEEIEVPAEQIAAFDRAHPAEVVV